MLHALALLLALSAPPDVAPGRYMMHTNAERWHLTLCPGGRLVRRHPSGALWRGRWAWDAAARTLHVREAFAEDGTAAAWRVRLDAGLRGHTDYGGLGGFDVRLDPLPQE